MDLDDEELKATRILNGADKNENIKILERMRDSTYGAMQFEDDYQVIELEEKEFNTLNLAIKALKERENLIKRNKELEEMIEVIEINGYIDFHKLLQDKMYYKKLASEYQGNCIPKSVIKEKIEEINKQLPFETLSANDYDNEIKINFAIRVLEELLEDK
jgi:hypothetical protein